MLIGSPIAQRRRMAISSGCNGIVKKAYLSLFHGTHSLLRSTAADISCRQLHCATLRRGLEEFFPKGEDIIEEAEKTGS